MILAFLLFLKTENQGLGIKAVIVYLPLQAELPLHLQRLLQTQNSPGYLFASAVIELVCTTAVSVHLIRGLKLMSIFVCGPHVFFQILTLSFKGMAM